MKRESRRTKKKNGCREVKVRTGTASRGKRRIVKIGKVGDPKK